MSRTLVASFFCLTAVFCAPAWSADKVPLQDDVRGVLSRLDAVDAAFKDDHGSVAEKSSALANSIGALRAAAAREGRESMFPSNCLRQVEIEAWELSKAAAPAQAAQRERLRDAMNLCTPFVALANPPAGEKEVDALLARAAASADRAEAALEKRSLQCSDGFKVDALLQSVAAGRFNRAELDHMRPALSPLIMQYYHLDAFARRDPSSCDLVDKVEEQFSEGWGCRALYGNLDFHYEYMTRGAGLAAACQSMIHSTYKELSAANQDAVCKIVMANVGHPKELCAQLTPRYLSGYKTESCVDDFTLLSVTNDKSCDATENGRQSWNERCREYAAFKRAYKAKDPSLCGNLEVCWALMGAWKGPIFKSYARRIQDGFCTAMSGYAHEEIGAALALLERSSQDKRPVVAGLQSRVAALSRRDADAAK